MFITLIILLVRTAMLAFALSLSCSCALAADIDAADKDALKRALATAKPGDTITLADGTWRDVSLHITTAGTAQANITIRAKTGGAVLFTGASTLTFAAPYVTVDGICFQNGGLTRSAKQVIRFNSHHGRLTNCAIVRYNPPAFETKYYWVFFSGDDNRVDHCFFTGKDHLQPLVGNDQNDSRRNRVDHCYLKDIPYHAANGREDFRIWGNGRTGDMGTDGAFFTIESNLFVHAHGEGQEIVSLKSNRNRVTGNTIRGTRGGITLRNGNYNTVEGNFIFAEGMEAAYGIRITGEHHTIQNNYIEGGSYGIDIMAGEFIDEKLTPNYEPKVREDTQLGRVPVYFWPKHNTISHNTIVNSRGPDFMLGGGYKAHWPAEQRILLPVENELTANLILRASGSVFECAVQDKMGTLQRFTFAGNTVKNNVVSGGNIAFESWFGPKDGFKIADPKLVKGQDGVYRPTGATAIYHPLTVDEVGPDWAKAKRQTGDRQYE